MFANGCVVFKESHLENMKAVNYLILFGIFCCITVNAQFINSKGATIKTRFIVPKGFQRVQVEQNSFEEYLQNLPLKPDGSEVLYFNGAKKKNNNIYIAVVDMSIGKADLQQCADAIMRLRGEYLYFQNRYSEIGFSYVKDGKKRLFSQHKDKTYQGFMKYMTTTFMYANTRSLKNDLTPKSMNKLSIGDVFIQSGNPYGHAVIVVDKIVHQTSKEVQYLLAQSYMPAQEIQILLNPNKAINNPWYSVTSSTVIETPEWTFYSNDLRTF
jgi:hypothetical protein